MAHIRLVQRLARYLRIAIPSASCNKPTKELSMNTRLSPPNNRTIPHSYLKTTETIEVKTSQPLKNWVWTTALINHPLQWNTLKEKLFENQKSNRVQVRASIEATFWKNKISGMKASTRTRLDKMSPKSMQVMTAKPKKAVGQARSQIKWLQYHQ